MKNGAGLYIWDYQNSLDMWDQYIGKERSNVSPYAAPHRRCIACLCGLLNVWMDTSMVMDPVALQISLNEIGPGRLLFGTDFPVAAMRGCRVRVMDHWVDGVLPGYPPSAYRVAGDGIRAGFMAWEIVLAIRWACEMVGISPAERDGIFYANGMARLQTVNQ